MNMSTITTISHFSKLIFFKRKPEDLPYSRTTLIMLLVGSILTIYILNGNSKWFKLLITHHIIQTVAFLSTIYYFLKKRGIENRFVQASCNILGLGIINKILLTFVISAINSQFVFCLFFAWILLIYGYIIQHTFEVSKGRSFFLLAVFFLIAGIIVSALGPIFSSDQLAELATKL